MENAMTLEEFRQARESGVDLYAEKPQQDQEDAAPEQEAEQEQEVEQDVEQPEEQQEESESEQPIPEEHKSAWAKRAERERKKAAEEVKARYEAELAKYKRFFDESGIDPEQAVKVLEQNRLKEEARRNVMAEANQLAYQYGWDDQQTEEYVNKQSELLSRQMQQENEMRELRVSVAINDLADKPDYPGIKTMKPQIMEFVKKNPSVPVEQAYWAVGGASLAQQLKREAEQREIAKRAQTPRKVVADAGKAVGDKNSLPPEAVEFMRREGLSEDQVRFLLSDSPKNLEDYRKMRRK
ncbi:hypothetical protein H7B90_23590 [Cohnella xylanilytica]|uniref:Scaffolding protein n=1 Tax=Cohnella xylanilytica TaxID=557555 RepID=A0A841U8F8_9BACL|nr:hypothetical protein [Cohnella xylanilytica]MBB6694384.1 hypothetical protein [Cohnella xylanilytica]